MKFAFEEPQAAYDSGSQNARAWTERWVGSSLYCPNCGHKQISQFPANQPVADFFCVECAEEFELKSQKRPFGAKVVDGAFRTMSERVLAENNPNLLLLRYDLERREVRDVTIVPKQFFVAEIIEKRKPLSPSARRANWVGCNILLGQIPSAGKIHLVRNGEEIAKEAVLAQWRQTLFLRDVHGEGRGWLVEVRDPCPPSTARTSPLSSGKKEKCLSSGGRRRRLKTTPTIAKWLSSQPSSGQSPS